MRCVLLRMLEVPGVMRGVVLCILEAVEGGALFAEGVGGAAGAGGNAPCAALYARGRGGWVLFARGAGGVGGAGGDTLCAYSVC